jgi:outer membrane protein assembly factor BamB
MTHVENKEPMPRKPLRLWPGVVLVSLQWLAWVAAPLVAPGSAAVAVIGAFGAGVALLVWWLFFSRAPWLERVGAIVLMVASVFVTKLVVHPSIANGMMGMMLPIYSIPVLGLALVAAAAAGRRRATGPRRAVMAAAIVLACAAFALVRTGGISGEGTADLHWRWTPTPEERLLAEAGEMRAAPASPAPAASPVQPSAAPPGESPPTTASAPPARPSTAPAATARAAWPGFRGPARDGVVPGVRIATDWAKSPPVELWRRPIGPGWSSFAVGGNLVYTQEQRGDDEIVSCYDLATGQPVWSHRDAARFWESNGGAGPRATPALGHGRVYALGATGILNALAAGTGAVAWSRNAASDTGAANPGWGFAGSPLVFDDLVVVATSGRLAAYDAATGEPRWLGPTGGAGYSSPHLATIDGVPQVLLTRGARTTSVAPADGSVLWEHSWQPAVSIVQPSVVGDGDVLVAAGDAMGGAGMRRLDVARGPAGWTVAERWTSRGLKPYFNDFVVHEGHAFGFDGSILASLDLADGARKWKGGRFGHGQILLLAEQDVVLVLSEEGELALVGATPDEFRELARFKAIEGKTWNHPVLVGDVLLVRNGEEMAAFRLSLARAQAD